MPDNGTNPDDSGEAEPQNRSGEWDPHLYQGLHSFVWQHAEDLLPAIGAGPGMRVLDVGCGTGQLTASVAQTGADVVGLDQSREMVAHARESFPAVAFVAGDVCQMEYDREFDAVFSNAALHWVTAADIAAARIAQALKPAGRFVAEFGGERNVATVVASLKRALAEAGVPNPERRNPWYFPSAAAYRRVLEHAGFRVEYIDCFDRPTQLAEEPSASDEQNHPGRDDAPLCRWLKMFAGAFLDGIPAHQHAAILSRTAELARGQLFYSGRWHLDYRRLRVIATREGGSPIEE